MRRALSFVAVCAALLIAASAESRADAPFLQRGYRPGHIFGNTVRTMVWGPSMSPSRGNYSRSMTSNTQTYSYPTTPYSRGR